MKDRGLSGIESRTPKTENPISSSIVTDSDVVPTSTCPDDVVDKLLRTLREFRWAAKVGPGIRIDDLPETPWRADILRYVHLTGEIEYDMIVFVGR